MSDLKLAYATSAAITNAIASLASSSTLVAGYESDVLDNTTNKYLDYLISGLVKVASSGLAAGVIEVWAIGILDDSTWPDVFDGTTSAETVTSRAVLAAHGKLVASINTDTTASVVYPFGPVSLASLFGGSVPKKVVFFTTHNTTQNLAASGHALSQTGVYSTSS